MSWNTKKNLLNHRYIKPIVKELKSFGYRVKLLSSSKKIGIPNAYGYCSREHNYVAVVRQDASGKMMTLEDIAFVLAHELRHVQHKEFGLYKSYYENREKNELPPPVAVGYRAELDCDRFAKEYVRNNCDRPSRLSYRRYSLKKVVGYTYYQILADCGGDTWLARRFWIYGEKGHWLAKRIYRRQQWGIKALQRELNRRTPRS